MGKILPGEILACLDRELIKIAESNRDIDITSILVKISNDLLISNSNITNEDYKLESFIVLGEIIKFSLKVAAIDKEYITAIDKNECREFFDRLKKDEISSEHIIHFLQKNSDILKKLVEVFAKNRYKCRKDNNVREIDEYSCDTIQEYLSYFDSSTKIPKFANIKNIVLQEDIINKCRDDIIKGIQIKKMCSNYELGQVMFASSDIGKMSKSQEDSVLILNHPENEKFKILVVADGLGGYEHGGEASNLVVQGIIEWFEKLDPNIYYLPHLLSYLLEPELMLLNADLLRYYDGRATTFVSAIVGYEDTLVTSLGDSRCYITKEKNIRQVSIDDSTVQSYLEKGLIKCKDDMRFHKLSNRISNFLGIDPYCRTITLHHYLLKNSDYERLILVSDGVSDCLSEEQIQKITTSAPGEKVAHALVVNALNHDSYRFVTRNEELDDYNSYYDFIPQGKDNTTAAVYVKVK